VKTVGVVWPVVGVAMIGFALVGHDLSPFQRVVGCVVGVTALYTSHRALFDGRY
jgi:hypothetical protein